MTSDRFKGPIKVSELVTVPHIALLLQHKYSIHHPGDERSRTHPGHGYPAHTETIEYISYYQFENEDVLTNWLLDNRYKEEIRLGKYRIIKVTPLKEEISIGLKAYDTGAK